MIRGRKNRRLAAVPTILSQAMVVKILVPSVTCYSYPDLFSEAQCFLMQNVYVKCFETCRPIDNPNLTWGKAKAGWLIIDDTKDPDTKIVEIVADESIAERQWIMELEKQQQMASAIASELVRSYSLPKAKRLARSLMKHAETFYPEVKPLTKITTRSMDDIMIILDGKTGLTKQQIFEYIKASASRQSNPRQAVLDICNKLFEFICYRPTTWVTNHLNIIITEDVRIRNNLFVMSAAEGNVDKLNYFIQEEHLNLLALHSELNYTALHAAADFGQEKIIERLIQTGLSLDIRDPIRGQTALHFAAESGRAAVAKILIENGANRELVNNDGVLPFQVADKHGYIEAREILKFLPPVVQKFQVTDATIHTISLLWQPPEINPAIHSDILDYQVEAQFVAGSVDIPHPPVVQTALVQYTYSDLYPSCTYRFRIKCRSVSGWSPYCPWMTAKTLQHKAEAPLPVEIRKVSINGLVLTWFPPKRDNGFPIDHYQLEIADYHAIHGLKNPNRSLGEDTPYIQLVPNEDEERHGDLTATESKDPEAEEEEVEKEEKSKPSDTIAYDYDEEQYRLQKERETAAARGPIDLEQQRMQQARQRRAKQKKQKDLATAAQSQGGVSKYYRLIKHRQLDLLLKYITGLEAHRLYQIRVRAHNELGYSPWSGWTPPIAPHIGVWVKTFLPQELSMCLTWFIPVINSPRQIESYELQLSVIQGPLVVNHPPLPSLHRKRKGSSSAPKAAIDGLAAAELAEAEDPETEKEEVETVQIGFIKLRDHSKPHHEINEFITLSNTITTNEYLVKHLKAGRKYQFRVRAKLVEEEEWANWEYLAVISDVIQMSSTSPDPPVNIRPHTQSHASFGTSSMTTTTNNNHSNTIVETFTLSAASPVYREGGEGGLSEEEEQRLREYEAAAYDRQEYLVNPVNIYFPKMIEIDELRVRQSISDSQQPLPLTTSVETNNNKNTTNSTTNKPALLQRENSLRSETSDQAITNSSLIPSEVSIANSQHTEYVIPKTRIELQDSFDISHNSITITFTNGDSNGSSITAYEIQLARIRDYHFQDLLYAKEAFLGIQEDDEDENEEEEEEGGQKKGYSERMKANMKPFVENPELANQPPPATSDNYNPNPETNTSTTSSKAREGLASPRSQENLLQWETVFNNDSSISTSPKTPTTNTNNSNSYSHNSSPLLLPPGTTTSRYSTEMVGKQCFRVHNLTPGETYIFRVRSKNEIGWSAFSHSSPLIATYPSIPPEKPLLLYKQQSIAILMWQDSDSSNRNNNIQTSVSSPMSGGTPFSRTRKSTANATSPPSEMNKSVAKTTTFATAFDEPPMATTLSTLEYQLQYRKVAINQVIRRSANSSSGTANQVLVEYLSDWEPLYSQIFTYDQLKKQAIFQQFLHPTATSTMGSNNPLTTTNPHLLTSLLADSDLDPATLRFVVLGNLVGNSWYMIRIRIRTVIGWSPWSSPSDPFCMAK